MICRDCERRIPPWERHHLRRAGSDENNRPTFYVLCDECSYIEVHG